jgi:hypothetical protein
VKRIHLFEFTDLPWYPHRFRRMQTDYLQFVSTLGSGHHNLIPLFAKALQHAGTNEIVDLCSGGTGPWMRLQDQLRQAGLNVNIKLTDKYPDAQSIHRWAGSGAQGIEYLSQAVDAMDVPGNLNGMRTLFEGFHHFKPAEARSILQDAYEKGAAIGVFEATLKPPLGTFLLLLAPVSTLFGYLFFTPFIKPRSFARFFWTYLLPVVPLATCWDGIVSMLRVYSTAELQELTEPLRSEDYVWEIGEASTGTPVFVFTYLIGYPEGVSGGVRQ